MRGKVFLIAYINFDTFYSETSLLSHVRILILIKRSYLLFYSNEI